MSNSAYDIPVFVVKGVKTSGHVSDLKPLEIGIFDRKTSSIATTSGNGTEFFLAGGKAHTKDKLTQFYAGMLDPKKSSYFKGKGLISFEKAYPSKPSNEEWVLGYDGSTSSIGLTYEKNKQYKLKVRLFGQAALKKYNREVERIIHMSTFVCSDGTYCDGDCVGTTVDNKKTTIEFVKRINSDVELQEFKIKAYPVFSDFAATTSTAFKYQITVSDNGDADGLFAIQRAYPTLKIVRVTYASGKSVYSVSNLAAAPADFTPTASVLLAACGVCPVGYTLVAGYDTWVVSRQLETTDDLSTDALKATYAANVATTYVSGVNGAISGSGVFLSIVDGQARVRIGVYAAKVLVPVAGSDQLEKLASTAAVCTIGSVAAVSWTQGEGGYTTTRTLKVTLVDQNCSGAVIATTADVIASLVNTTSYVAGSATDATGADVCSKSFTIVQTSNVMTDLCASPDVATYDVLPFFKGVQWVEVVTVTTPDNTVKCGIRFTAPYFSTKFNDASFAPDEYYDSEPMQMEVSLFDQSGNPCGFAKNGLGKKTKQGKFRRLSGEFVSREVARQGAYFTYEQWFAEPRIREVMNNVLLEVVSRDKYYVAYYLRFKDSRGDVNFNQKSEVFEAVMFVEEDKASVQTALENSLLAITSKFDVELQKRG